VGALLTIIPIVIHSFIHSFEIAQELVELARSYSLDKMRESPFEITTKDNGYLWSGGMPDDVTSFYSTHTTLIVFSSKLHIFYLTI